MTRLQGIAASDGIATAKAYMLVQPDLSFSKSTITDSEKEINRLHKALQDSTDDLKIIRKIAAESLGEEEAQVFDAHMMILADPEFTGAIEGKIKDDKVNAEQALKEVADLFVATFEAMTDNAYMQERAADIKDVTKRVLSHLLGVTLPNPALIDEEVIVIAHDLTPSDTAQLNGKFVKAFVTDIGGRTSHSAIMARSLEIPAIVGTETITSAVEAGEELIVDGINGVVVLDPTAADVAEYDAKAKDFAAQKTEWEKLKNEKSVTKDGKALQLQLILAHLKI
ncbi:phosphoenolpyruvate-utilizing N-terminal domain-containing protein [Latilactobacillus fuchuensis]|uniref:phosphoenolpyruvate-utilizing N-terminal domain-containing protein n=1 Tax=Latilactobacillus fuchuensis TaxID=164393 RepID=UPI000AA114CF|nr:phosphoenolpyruvate-utilizing N-terminal domain-containing protein [Latilactobacillus fuchuensis]